MRLFKILLAGAAMGVILAAFRDFEHEAWLVPARLGGADGGDPDGGEMEPVLGYDGMDVDTLLDWLGDAELDSDTVERMHRYELAHRGRDAVLSALEDRLG